MQTERCVQALQSFLVPDERVAVAVSGGGDSVALLRMLHQIMGPSRLVVLHFNHNLREESASEELWVQQLATQLQIPFFSRTWAGPVRGNKQQAARHARYAFFKEIVENLGLAGVCVGHTEGDITETLLMRLGRGSGVQGLAAMKAQTKIAGVYVFRPLLGYARDDLRQYLDRYGARLVGRSI